MMMILQEHVLGMDVRLKEPERHKAVLIDAIAAREQFLETLLLDRGILIVERYTALSELLALRSPPVSDLIILYLTKIDETVSKALRAVRERFECAILVVTENTDETQIENLIVSGADSVLPIGAGIDRMKCAVALARASFEQSQSLRNDVRCAHRQLEERKLIERAKGILMTQRGITEPDAFRKLQETSMKQNQALSDVARRVIEAKELLG